MSDKIYSKLSLIKALTFALSCAKKEFGEYPDELENFGNTLHLEVLDLEKMLEEVELNEK